MSCLSFWVPRAIGPLHPPVIQMLGGSEFRLRQGFACGKTLVRRIGAAGQKTGWVVLLQRSCQSKISILTVPPSSSQAAYRLRRAFSFHCKTHRAPMEAAPRFHVRPAVAGRAVGRRPVCVTVSGNGNSHGPPTYKEAPAFPASLFMMLNRNRPLSGRQGAVLAENNLKKTWLRYISVSRQSFSGAVVSRRPGWAGTERSRG